MVKIITIDGPASVGKSEISKKLSKKFKAPILISGRLYRAVAYEVIKRGINLKNKKKILECAKKINNDDINSNRLYSSEVDNISSQISSIKELRSQLLKYQRKFPKLYAGTKKCVIIEGRDIGTIIFPKADLKIFMWASSEARAKRRVAQIAKTKKKPNISQIHKLIIERDIRDMSRKTAPLVPAADSYLIDTTFLDIEQTFNSIVRIVRSEIYE